MGGEFLGASFVRHDVTYLDFYDFFTVGVFTRTDTGCDFLDLLYALQFQWPWQIVSPKDGMHFSP